MIPGFGIPLGDGGWNWEIFTPNQSAGTEFALRPWVRPPGVNWVYFLACGGGGAGGSGFTGVAGSNRGGGGGGGASGVTSWLLPAFMCPSVLYLRAGRGGIPGGSAASPSIITLRTDSTNGALFTVVNGGPGGNGTGTAAGTSGSQGGLVAAGQKTALGFLTSSTGSGGSAGGAHTGAVGGSQFPDGMVSSGAGGAGVSTAGFDGGGVTPNSNMGIQLPAALGGTAASPNGQPGLNLGAIPKFGQRLRYDQLSNIFGSGGGGGRSENAAPGGRGGDAGPGCGGGGGGAGTTGGLGGRGGDGFILVGWL